MLLKISEIEHYNKLLDYHSDSCKYTIKKNIKLTPEIKADLLEFDERYYMCHNEHGIIDYERLK